MNPLLSIIISNRNDLVMLSVTLNSVFDALAQLPFESEVVLCDNSDEIQQKLLDKLIPDDWLRNRGLKLLKLQTPGLSAARTHAIENASGRFILCIDSHALISPKLISDTINFLCNPPTDRVGFAHPPINWAHRGSNSIRHTVKPSPEGYPSDGWDTRYNHIRKMFWKWMPWACERNWWLNTLKGYGTHAKLSISWGGADMLQQIKCWMLGYENWAIPTLPLIHIGPFTEDINRASHYRYRLYHRSGNYPHGYGELVALAVLAGPELGRKLIETKRSKFEQLHNIKVEDFWQTACSDAHEEHTWLYSNCKYTYEELIAKKVWEE